MSPAVQVFAILLSGAAALIGGLVLLNLRQLKHSLGKQEQRVENARAAVTTLTKEMSVCKVDCERSFVSAELFLRETGLARRTMENLTTSISRMEGTLTVVEKIPQICGDITRAVISEMNNGAKKNG